MHWSNSTDTILVPDRPPREITVKHVGEDVVQLKWSPVFSENTIEWKGSWVQSVLQ